MPPRGVLTTELGQPPLRKLWVGIRQAKHVCPPLQGLLEISHDEHWLKVLAWQLAVSHPIPQLFEEFKQGKTRAVAEITISVETYLQSGTQG